MSDEWVPLPQRMGWDAEAYESLHEDIPPWLRVSLGHWVGERLTNQYGLPTGSGRDVLRETERRCRFELAWGNPKSPMVALLGLMREEPASRFLCALDLILSKLDDYRARTAGVELEAMLAEAGSAWRVAVREGKAVLERRVEQGVETTAEKAMEGEGPAAHLLRDAWHAAYGREPNPSEAYRDAVRAVEAAAQPVVIPADRTATLGKMVPVLRDGPGKWTVALSANDVVPIEVVRDMMQLLWQGQHDRHGKPDPDGPLDVGDAEAEAAVHLAATLVHWFRSGAIRRAEQLDT